MNLYSAVKTFTKANGLPDYTATELNFTLTASAEFNAGFYQYIYPVQPLGSF
jgi:hypothetical protein